MITAILDTNIYGILLADNLHGVKLIEKIKTDPNFIIHNFKLIRNELRGAPKTLPIYDKLVANNVVEETKPINKLQKIKEHCSIL